MSNYREDEDNSSLEKRFANEFKITSKKFAEKLIKELGGKITKESSSGSLYVEIGNGEVVRISNHRLKIFDEFDTRNKGFDTKKRYFDYNYIDYYFTDKCIDTYIEEIRSQLDY